MRRSANNRKGVLIDGQAMTYKAAATRFGMSTNTVKRIVKDNQTHRLTSEQMVYKPKGRPSWESSGKTQRKLDSIPGPTPYELALWGLN